MSWNPDIFKAYDIRGRVPADLDADLAYALGRALGAVRGCRSAAVGHDIRLTSPALADALMEGLADQGAHVFCVGPCGTEEIYHATPLLSADAGVMITASHNPREWNGMKIVGAGSVPLPPDALAALRDFCLARNLPAKRARGRIEPVDPREDYIRLLRSFVDPTRLAGLRIVADSGHGGAGAVVDRLAEFLPAAFERIRHEPDGTFPTGVPNPLLPENRERTAQAVRSAGADLGIAWDGDFDRCFFFDGTGAFVEGYYMVALLAERMLAAHPGDAVVHDPRLTWNTIERVTACGGRPVASRTGHAFLKAKLRETGAVYGGEMSAHHYFRDFHCCDSGMIPWLLVADTLGRSGAKLADLVRDMAARFPCSGEINRRVADVPACLAAAEAAFSPGATAVDRLDGLSVEHARWRFNLRGSNTEPLLRLNVETRGDFALLEERTAALLDLIDRTGRG